MNSVSIYLDQLEKRKQEELSKREFSRGKRGMAGSLIFQSFGEPPSSPMTGMMYVNREGKVHVYDGNQWMLLSGDSSEESSEQRARRRTIRGIIEGEM